MRLINTVMNKARKKEERIEERERERKIIEERRKGNGGNDKGEIESGREGYGNKKSKE